METSAPPQYSADGEWWWNGQTWIPVTNALHSSAAADLLDEAVDATRESVNAHWGVAAVLAVGWIAFVEAMNSLLVATGVRLHLGEVGASLLAIGLELSLAVVVIVALRFARIPGGWRQALGLGRFVRRDFGTIALWSVIQFAMRIAAISLLIEMIHGSSRDFVPNNPLYHATYDLYITIVLFVVVVVLAPFVEELVFRGLVLRALMRRFGFAIAAIVSSALFGLAHAHEEPTLIGATIITVMMFTFGLLQCFLVRRTGRLVPAIGVHMTLNGVAFAFALLN